MTTDACASPARTESPSRHRRTVIVISMVAGLVLASSASALITMTRRHSDAAPTHDQTLSAGVLKALQTPTAMDAWTTQTARDPGFREGPSVSTRQLYAAWRTTTTRTVAIDITSANGVHACLIAKATVSGKTVADIDEQWHNTRCADAVRQK